MDTSGQLYPRVGAPGTHCTGWVGPKTGLYVVAKIKKPIIALRGIEPRSFVLTELPRLLGGNK